MNQFGVLSRKNAAEYLGVSLPLLDRYIHRESNPIPVIRTARKYLIPLASLDEWIAAEASRQGGCIDVKKEIQS